MAISEERLLFPGWSAPGPRRRDKRSEKAFIYLCAVGFVTMLLLCLWRTGRRVGTDQVLGRALESEYKDPLDLGAHNSTFRISSRRVRNPWRGAGNRMRYDLLSSVSGCGGKYRPRLSEGDTASLLYYMRDSNGSLIDRSSGGRSIDVVLGSDQLGPEIEKRLRGLCAGETMIHKSGNRVFVAHVQRVGRIEHADKRAERLEMLAEVVAAVRASRGVTCNVACHRKGMQCTEEGFRIINACPKLRESFACRSCETAAAGSSGPDMPCYVELSAPVGHPRGSCMVNPKIETATCTAKYAHTRRLCPCTTSPRS